MTLYKCQTCGVRIPDMAIIRGINKVKDMGLISGETWNKAERRIRQGAVDPHITCHNPDCDGLLMKD